MPLRQRVEKLDPCPTHVREAAKRLRSISVTCVELGARGTPATPFHWVYFPETQFPFYRVGSPSQVNPALAPPGHTSFAVEYSHQGPTPDHQGLIDGAIDGLERAGLLKRSDVVLARARTIRTAYVLVDHACGEARRVIYEHLATHGIELAGRYGQWEYSGMEDALVSGDAAAARILAKLSPAGNETHAAS
jgi:protoporphyrinogen oxidase